MYTITHPHAIVAIRAALHRKAWGRVASWRYAEKRGCPRGLYVLACILHAAGE